MGRKTRKPPVVAAGGGSGDFVGPASATNTALVLFDGTTGKLGKNSLVTIDGTGSATFGNGTGDAIALNFNGATLDGTIGWNGSDYQFTFTGDAVFNDHVYFNNLVRFTGVVSPTQITSDQNNYSPTGLSTSNVLRVSTDASRTITGIVTSSSGRLLLLHNIGSNILILSDENASSTAANRFALTRNISLGADQSIALWYDITSSRWRAFDHDLAGDVVGPASSTDNYLASYSGATGKLIKETALKATISGSTISLLFDTLVTDGTLQWLGSGDGFQFLDDVLMASDEFLAFRTSAQKIWSSATATLDIDSTAGTINIGHDGHCDFGGSGTAYAMRPQTDNNADLGDSTHEWRDVFVDGTVQTDALRIDEGGSTTIGAGVGSVKMTSATAATNTAWIPINYAGTVYYVPAWTTNSP